MSEAIVATDISKVFRISHDPVRSLKERIVSIGRRAHTDFQALSQMSFTIEQGETIGILGHNGSGKSTLLKCIAGILRPTTGQIALRGRLASLLELGAGFHPELTGRENVFINAAFLGISRKEISGRLDDIVEFAELGQFIDEPVKHYSSGMYVRLGFAVAVNLQPDILLVDEVLAVGDESFARKCLARVKDLQADGRTIVVVTHAADVVRQTCSRALVLDHGLLVADTKPAEAIAIFRQHLHGTLQDDDVEHHRGPWQLGQVELAQRDGRAQLQVEIVAEQPSDRLVLGVEVNDRGGRLVFRTDSDQLGLSLDGVAGRAERVLTFDTGALMAGLYPVIVRLTERGSDRLLDWRELNKGVTVHNSTRGEGVVDLAMKMEER
jgi:ABC-2 type transport system ATP-binding protein